MSRNNKKRNKANFAPTISLRETVKIYRKKLAGEESVEFDYAFCISTGHSSMKTALAKGSDLQAAFIAAKEAANACKKKHPIVEPTDDPYEEDDAVKAFAKLSNKAKRIAIREAEALNEPVSITHV